MKHNLRHPHPLPLLITAATALLLASWAPLAAGQSSGSVPPAENPHQGVDCRRCHLQLADRQEAGLTDPDRCRSCHPRQSVGSDQDLGFHGAAAGGRCLECHTFHNPDRIATGLGEITLTALANLDRAHCGTCHQPDRDLAALSDAHQAAARLYHEQAGALQDLSPSQACLNCHSGTGATDWQGAAGGRVLAFSEHATHPFGVAVVPGRGDFAHRIRRELDPRIQLFDQQIQCQTCHNLTATGPDLLVAFPTSKALCLGCHQFRDGSQELRDDLLATMGR